MPTALVLGATGLVGKALTQLLLQDNKWQEVHVFVRRSTGMQHSRLREHIINFDQPESWSPLVKGDVLFSSLGTTLATAGSKEAQYKVDHTYQYQFAAAAAANGVSRYVLVSAANASLNSMFFYSKMKAELDRDVSQLPFEHIAIMRPGMLAGERTEKRVGEKIALQLASVLQHIPGLGMLQPIQGTSVAKAMIVVALRQTAPKSIYKMKELFELAEQYKPGM